jgi:hypothetical protein
MSAVANELKCTTAELKYEQLLSDKYFVETCFSKRYESYSPKNKLTDLYFKISGLPIIDYPTCEDAPECAVPWDDTTTTSTTTTTTASSTTTTTTVV